MLGPRGSGTSTLARLAARGWAACQPHARSSGGPLQVVVPTSVAHGPRGAMAAILRALDPEYEHRNFAVTDLAVEFLRRLRRLERSAVVVFDDVGPAAPDLSGFLAGLLDPDSFLPEGGESVPPIAVVVAGTVEALRAIGGPNGSPALSARTIRLPPYTESELVAIVRDRAERCLARPVPSEWVGRLVRRAVRENGTAVRALELLRREVGGVSVPELGPVYPRGSETAPIVVEPPLLSALGQLDDGAPIRVGELRERTRELARSYGEPPIAATTFWRRIIRLERAGVVRRSVRTGGVGGSLSTVSVVRPVGEWPLLTARSRILPAGGTRPDLSPMGAAPLGEWDPEPRGRRGEPSALPFAMSGDGPA